MDLIEPVFDAVVNGEEQLILMYLNMGANISAQGDDGQNVLHWAAASPFGEQLLSFLISRGADINAEDNMGYTPLHLHSLRGRAYGTSCLLQAGAAVNAVSSKNGFTPLHLAILHNHIEVANILLAYGADYQLLENLRDLALLTQGKLAPPITGAANVKKITATAAAAAEPEETFPTSQTEGHGIEKTENIHEHEQSSAESSASSIPSSPILNFAENTYETPMSAAATIGGEDAPNPQFSLTPIERFAQPARHPQQERTFDPHMDAQAQSPSEASRLKINLLSEFATPPAAPPAVQTEESSDVPHQQDLELGVEASLCHEPDDGEEPK